MSKHHGMRSAAVKDLSPSSYEDLRRAVAGDSYWADRLAGLVHGRSHPFSLHLGVFVEPYLGYVLSGRKTIESRFSVVRCPPYRRVQRGDTVLLKVSGGPIVGLCEVRDTWYYQLDPDSWRFIRKEFAEALCAQDPEFWRLREKASYATLLRINRVARLPSFPWAKRDRRGWVVVAPGTETTLFEDV